MLPLHEGFAKMNPLPQSAPWQCSCTHPDTQEFLHCKDKPRVTVLLLQHGTGPHVDHGAEGPQTSVVNPKIQLDHHRLALYAFEKVSGCSCRSCIFLCIGHLYYGASRCSRFAKCLLNRGRSASGCPWYARLSRGLAVASDLSQVEAGQNSLDISTCLQFYGNSWTRRNSTETVCSTSNSCGEICKCPGM